MAVLFTDGDRQSFPVNFYYNPQTRHWECDWPEPDSDPQFQLLVDRVGQKIDWGRSDRKKEGKE